jgi:hypothetical protein
MTVEAMLLGYLVVPQGIKFRKNRRSDGIRMSLFLILIPWFHGTHKFVIWFTPQIYTPSYAFK